MRCCAERATSGPDFAFQIRDQLLDVEASSEQLSKTAGNNAAANKPT